MSVFNLVQCLVSISVGIDLIEDCSCIQRRHFSRSKCNIVGQEILLEVDTLRGITP